MENISFCCLSLGRAHSWLGMGKIIISGQNQVWLKWICLMNFTENKGRQNFEKKNRFLFDYLELNISIFLFQHYICFSFCIYFFFFLAGKGPFLLWLVGWSHFRSQQALFLLFGWESWETSYLFDHCDGIFLVIHSLSQRETIIEMRQLRHLSFSPLPPAWTHLLRAFSPGMSLSYISHGLGYSRVVLLPRSMGDAEG